MPTIGSVYMWKKEHMPPKCLEPYIGIYKSHEIIITAGNHGRDPYGCYTFETNNGKLINILSEVQLIDKICLIENHE